MWQPPCYLVTTPFHPGLAAATHPGRGLRVPRLASRARQALLALRRWAEHPNPGRWTITLTLTPTLDPDTDTDTGTDTDTDTDTDT